MQTRELEPFLRRRLTYADPKESALATVLQGRGQIHIGPVKSHQNLLSGSKARLAGPHRGCVCSLGLSPFPGV